MNLHQTITDACDSALSIVEGFINRIPWLKRLYMGLVLQRLNLSSPEDILILLAAALAVMVGLAALAIGWLV